MDELPPLDLAYLPQSMSAVAFLFLVHVLILPVAQSLRECLICTPILSSVAVCSYSRYLDYLRRSVGGVLRLLHLPSILEYSRIDTV